MDIEQIKQVIKEEVSGTAVSEKSAIKERDEDVIIILEFLDPGTGQDPLDEQWDIKAFKMLRDTKKKIAAGRKKRADAKDAKKKKAEDDKQKKADDKQYRSTVSAVIKAAMWVETELGLDLDKEAPLIAFALENTQQRYKQDLQKMRFQLDDMVRERLKKLSNESLQGIISFYKSGEEDKEGVKVVMKNKKKIAALVSAFSLSRDKSFNRHYFTGKMFADSIVELINKGEDPKTIDYTKLFKSLKDFRYGGD